MTHTYAGRAGIHPFSSNGNPLDYPELPVPKRTQNHWYQEISSIPGSVVFVTPAGHTGARLEGQYVTCGA